MGKEKIKPKTTFVPYPRHIKQIRALDFQIDYEVTTYQLCSSKDVTRQ